MIDVGGDYFIIPYFLWAVCYPPASNGIQWLQHKKETNKPT